jgi:hypothetical protein
MGFRIEFGTHKWPVLTKLLKSLYPSPIEKALGIGKSRSSDSQVKEN